MERKIIHSVGVTTPIGQWNLWKPKLNRYEPIVRESGLSLLDYSYPYSVPSADKDETWIRNIWNDLS
jgi:hypothetical protein